MVIQVTIEDVKCIPVTGSIPRCPLFVQALSYYGITKQEHKYIIPILIVFKHKISHCTVYYFDCVLGYIFYCFIFIVTFQNTCPFWCLVLFLSKTPYYIFTYKKSSQFVCKYLYRPLSNRGSIEKYQSSIIFLILSNIFQNSHPNLINSTFGKNKILIAPWSTESAELKNLANRTEIDLT